MRVVAVIPAYNAESTLSIVVSGLNDIGLTDGIIVNDGSTDSTKDISTSFKMINHSKQMGVGAALKTGFKSALEQGAELVLTIGADNQRNFVDCLKLLEEKETDLVIGVKNLNSPNIPTGRKIAGKILTRLFNFKTFLAGGKFKISDCLSGFRVLNKDALQIALGINEDDYSFDVRLLRAAISHGLRIKEVPVEVYYHKDSTRMRVPALTFFKILYKLIKN